MPIISKPLLVFGSLAGVSLLSVGSYLGVSALDSKQVDLPETSESGVSSPPGLDQDREFIRPRVEASERSEGQTRESEGIPVPAPNVKNSRGQGASDLEQQNQEDAVRKSQGNPAPALSSTGDGADTGGVIKPAAPSEDSSQGTSSTVGGGSQLQATGAVGTSSGPSSENGKASSNPSITVTLPSDNSQKDNSTEDGRVEETQ